MYEIALKVDLKLWFCFGRLNFKPGPDNHCRLSKLSLAKRSELFGQLLTSLCRVPSHPAPFVIAFSRFLYPFPRRCVAAKLCNVSDAAFGAHPLPPSWSCSCCCPYSVVIRHFILFCTFYYDCRLRGSSYIFYYYVCLSACGKYTPGPPPVPAPKVLPSIVCVEEPHRVAPSRAKPSHALKCAFRAARLGAPLYSSLIVWMMTTSAASKAHKAALWC